MVRVIYSITFALLCLALIVSITPVLENPKPVYGQGIIPGTVVTSTNVKAAISGPNGIVVAGTTAVTSTTSVTAYLPQSVQITVFEYATTVTTGTGNGYFVATPILNGKTINHVNLTLITTGTTGTNAFQLKRTRSGSTVDVLSTVVSVDSEETSSITAAVPAVINTSNDDVATGDVFRLDCTNATDSAALGAIFSLEMVP